MPTVIALDVSLSMSRLVKTEGSEEYDKRHLAIHGINTLLDQINAHSKLEFVSLVVFSYLYEQLVSFTREYDTIKTALNKVEVYNKTCIETALNGISAIILEEWGNSSPCQVILITDGSPGIGQGSLKNFLLSYSQNDAKTNNAKSPLPFKFPCKLHVVCIASGSDPDFKNSLSMYEKMIEINGQGGEVFYPESTLSLKSVQQTFSNLAEKYFHPFHGVLHCGNLKNSVQLFPHPVPYFVDSDLGKIERNISHDIHICGFMDISDVSSPPTISRHLVIPMAKDKTKLDDSVSKDGKNGKSEDDEDVTTVEEGKIPAFTVMLHGSLKVEGMVAIAQVDDDWYAMLFSWADSKKKSNLLLALFEPGIHSISWLGSLNKLAPVSDFEESPYGPDDTKTPFPLRPSDKRSYAQSCVVWIKPGGLQADLQKVLRHARKLPDKQQQFYKELNRIRRAALSFGFLDLLDAIATMLDRECTMLPGTAHPSAALQLSHAANTLRSEMACDASQMVLPLQTNFSKND
ncbi:hypothetical protein SNE40_012164 [Patella caerulea]|uniref:Integrator complex subunit 14 n=1 Tax=Patella caerulea TaxID=87958 RepID=A0AAN8JPA3_PATCE